MSDARTTTTIIIENYAYIADGDTYYRACSRCAGVGRYMFNGETDTCYRCAGSKEDPNAKALTLEDAKRNAANRARAAERAQDKREAEHAERMTALDAKIQRYRGTHPDVVAALEVAREQDQGGFLGDMAALLFWAVNIDRELSERQIAAIQRVAHDNAAATPVPEMRARVTGKIVSVKEEEDHYSRYGGSTFKMLVEDATGFRVFGTIPASLCDQLFDEYRTQEDTEGIGTDQIFSDFCKGREVAFTASLIRSERDASFGFFKRPRV